MALVQVDHQNIVTRGLPVVNRALKTGDLSPLQELLKSLPFDDSKELEEHLRQRVAKLRKGKAPPFLIEAEERRLASLRRPQLRALQRASVEELRLMLGGWCRDARTTDLDKAWDLIHWYSDPNRRRRPHGDWRAQHAGFQPSLFDFAVYGQEPYPKDVTGQPVIRTGGSPDMSWYNPPGTVAKIAAAVSLVLVNEWDPIDREIKAGPARSRPYGADIGERLQYARETFDRFAKLYQGAASRGFGVSVEFY